MTEILNDISTWSILKWVIIVLVAGFIGQFGKTMAQAVIGKIRRKNAPQNVPAAIASANPIAPKEDTPDALTQGPPVTPRERTGIPDKKALKILAKQQKKAAKQAQKN